MPPRLSTANPFSSSQIRPGAVAFLFEPGESIESCLARWERNGHWGQIRGPHGSGKSTLLAALLPKLREQGWRVEHLCLHQGQRRLPVGWPPHAGVNARTVLVIDGLEQLAWWRRGRLKRLCRQRGWGLLATTHRNLGLPDLYVTRPTVELAQRVAARLLEGWPALIAPDDVERCFTAHAGDMRETFFALYDLFEARRKSTSAS